MPQSIRMSVSAPYNQRTHVEVNIIWMWARQPTIWKHSKNQFAATVLIEMCAVFGGAMWPSFCLRHVWMRDSPALDLGVFSELLTAMYELCLMLLLVRRKKSSRYFLWLIYKLFFFTFIEDSVFTSMVSFFCSFFCLFIDELHWGFH